MHVSCFTEHRFYLFKNFNPPCLIFNLPPSVVTQNFYQESGSKSFFINYSTWPVNVRHIDALHWAQYIKIGDFWQYQNLTNMNFCCAQSCINYQQPPGISNITLISRHAWLSTNYSLLYKRASSKVRFWHAQWSVKILS